MSVVRTLLRDNLPIYNDADVRGGNISWQKSAGGAWCPDSEADVSQRPYTPGQAV